MVIEEFKLIPGNDKGCWVYLDKDYNGEGPYEIHEIPQTILKKVDGLRKWFFLKSFCPNSYIVVYDIKPYMCRI